MAEEGRAAVVSHRAKHARSAATACSFYDKVPLKYAGWSAAQFAAAGVRVVPPATVRRGAFVAPNVVLMPSYVNIGAYVDSGTMVDTWATVGSCAQIGKNVHLSGGVGIGGVLEPLQASPTIIEDDCFIGARSEIVEGVIVETGAVMSMGVFIGQSTRIYDRERDEILYGRVPAGAVVVPGTSARGERQVLARLRGDRQAGRCADSRQDLVERIASGRRVVALDGAACPLPGSRAAPRSAEAAGDVVFGEPLLRIGEDEIRGADFDQICPGENTRCAAIRAPPAACCASRSRSRNSRATRRSDPRSSRSRSDRAPRWARPSG